MDDPSRPHGVWDQQMTVERDTLRIEPGLKNYSGEVTTINQVYAFTRAHVRRMFQILDRLGVADIRDLGPGEDIVLSFSGAKPPMCHDVGPFEVCPTFDREGVAVWKREGFSARRIDLFCRIYTLITGPIIVFK